MNGFSDILMNALRLNEVYNMLLRLLKIVHMFNDFITGNVLYL